MRRHAPTALALFALLVAGCGDGDRQAAPERRPRGFHPDRFPDIPLPPGFAIDPERDQLAVVMAGGLVRRFDVRVLEKKSADRQTPEAVLAWYGRILPPLGWTPVDADGGERSWRREHAEGVAETLRISAAGMRTTAVELELVPGAAAR